MWKLIRIRCSFYHFDVDFNFRTVSCQRLCLFYELMTFVHLDVSIIPLSLLTMPRARRSKLSHRIRDTSRVRNTANQMKHQVNNEKSSKIKQLNEVNFKVRRNASSVNSNSFITIVQLTKACIFLFKMTLWKFCANIAVKFVGEMPGLCSLGNNV